MRDYDKARARAKQDGKFLFVYFHAIVRTLTAVRELGEPCVLHP